ncbi:endonuclease/exonuclease/phosphatase family protein [Dactylosporangium sp. NPDC051485]|uniref:endonuclease/exonuclease/phosphatase family protein n=1 Tax=Dactylosporangium sp. NPDC051485 TaxID=3154846 RepID=UPI00341E9E6F
MTVVCWVVAGLAAAFAAVRLLGAERGTPLTQLVTYTPYAAAGALLAGGIVLAAGATGPGLLCLGAGVVLAGLVVSRLVPGRAPADGVRLRVMAANLLFGAAATARFVEQVKVDDIDVLAVQELTEEGLAALHAAGIEALLPHRVVAPRPGGGGAALFSRHPIDEPEVRLLPPVPMAQTRGLVRVPGAGAVLVESAHPYPPRRGWVRVWRDNLADQPRPDPAGPPVVLLGDFNATADHAALRRLLRAGFRDAASARGRGLAPTWPRKTSAHAALPFWTPPVPLDHVLVERRIGVREFGTRVIAGSDHWAVVAELVLKPSTM